VNVHTEQDGLLHVDVERLIALNSLPGVTLATRRQYATIGPSFKTTQVATLKIIPYAIPKHIVEQAVTLAKGVLTVASLPAQRIALLITSEEASAPRIVRQFETPTRARLEKLGSELISVEAVELDERAIASAAQRLLALHDALIIGGQTSIMDIEDITPRALSHIGAEVVLHGAPVEPGNLLALAYYGSQWILCAPGCAKSPSLNIVDFVLPRLIAGERLEEAEIAEMGLGGLL
jgi:molybdenum cofactor cytidylyltransferase